MLDGRALKAWTPGGSSTPLLTAAHADTGLDYESLAAAGSMLGTAAIMVLDETDCVVDCAQRMVAFYAHESCGKCTPCREGTLVGHARARTARGRLTAGARTCR